MYLARCHSKNRNILKSSEIIRRKTEQLQFYFNLFLSFFCEVMKNEKLFSMAVFQQKQRFGFKMWTAIFGTKMITPPPLSIRTL